MNKIIPIDIYSTDCLVVFGNKEELEAELYKLCGVGDWVVHTDDIDEQCCGKAIRLSSGQIVLWMPQKPHDAKDYGVLAHYIFHCASFLMERIGVSPSSESEEAYAYLIQYLTKEITSFLKDGALSLSLQDDALQSQG